MIGASSLVALAAASPVLASYVGFNYGSTFTTGAAKVQSDFESEFTTAQGLISAPEVFNSARLYTMVQGGTTDSPIEAIPAAINTKTSLLFGMWASGGDADFANELSALKAAISIYGSKLDGLVAGISVGSEDLYRISPTGIANGEYAGAEPDTIVGYINQVRNAIAGTALSSVPVGHVDTWTAWVNSSNDAVISACDWLGVDAYPYFQTTVSNSISDGESLFDSALSQTQAAAGGKDVWVTETGWPVSGPQENLAVASIANAKTYWDEVGCSLFGKTNVWWYTVQDAAPDTPSPSFGIVGSTLTTTPLYDLSCNASDTSSSSTASASASASESASASASASATGTASASDSTGTVSSLVATASGADSGSPGITVGVGSIVSAGASGTATGSGSGAAATGGSSSPSGAGSSGSGSSGSGGVGVNGTIATSSSPSSTGSTTPITASGASANVVSFGAAFVALLAACLVL